MNWRHFTLFHSARLRLTGWYLLILMVISLAFSAVIYNNFLHELDRISHYKRPLGPPGLYMSFQLDSDFLDQIKERMLFRLAFINGVIFAGAGLAGYFLAGRTLRPIQDMLEEQNRFTADASHELRTPLTSLKTEVEVALRDKYLPLQAREILTSNLEEINKLRAIADGLLVLAKDGIPQKDFHPVSVRSIMAQAKKKILPTADNKGIGIVTQGEDISVQGEEESLISMATIFLDNAVKYSPPKGQVTLSWNKRVPHAVITIEDTGIGIPAHDLPHIFKRFYRADNARAREEASGYGLGLSIAKAIIEAHDGDVRVKSRPDEGTVFTILLPLAP